MQQRLWNHFKVQLPISTLYRSALTSIIIIEPAWFSTYTLVVLPVYHSEGSQIMREFEPNDIFSTPTEADFMISSNTSANEEHQKAMNPEELYYGTFVLNIISSSYPMI